MFTYQQPFVMGLGRADVGNFFVAYSTMAILVRVVFGGPGLGFLWNADNRFPNTGVTAIGR